jgi:hypothetical protein
VKRGKLRERRGRQVAGIGDSHVVGEVDEEGPRGDVHSQERIGEQLRPVQDAEVEVEIGHGSRK